MDWTWRKELRGGNCRGIQSVLMVRATFGDSRFHAVTQPVPRRGSTQPYGVGRATLGLDVLSKLLGSPVLSLLVGAALGENQLRLRARMAVLLDTATERNDDLRIHLLHSQY